MAGKLRQVYEITQDLQNLSQSAVTTLYVGIGMYRDGNGGLYVRGVNILCEKLETWSSQSYLDKMSFTCVLSQSFPNVLFS